MNKIGNIEVNTPPEGYKKSLKSRVIVAIILVALFLPMLILGGWYFFFGIMGFLLIAIAEVIRAPRKQYNWTVYVFTYMIVLSYVYWMFFKENMAGYFVDPEHYQFSLENYCSNYEISIFGIATSLFVYCFEGIVDKNFTLADVTYFVFMTLLVGIGFQAMYFLRFFTSSVAYHETFASIAWGSHFFNAELTESNLLFKFLGSCELLVFVVLGPIFNDIFAYFGGIYFGKHKLNERVSPKKTWEGFYFGWVGGFVLTFAFGFIMAAIGLPVLPFLTTKEWYWILLIAIVNPLLADIGDLTFSLIKRYYQIKDYGDILRGHGGILDRIDSIIFSVIGTVMIIVLIRNGWNFLI